MAATKTTTAMVAAAETTTIDGQDNGKCKQIVLVDGGPGMRFGVCVHPYTTALDLQAAILQLAGMNTAKLYPGDNRDPRLFVVLSHNNKPLYGNRTLAAAGVVGTTPVHWWPANV